MKKKIIKKILLIGGGRWAQIYLNELIKNKVKVYVLSSNKGLKKIFINHKFKDYKIFKKFADINIKTDFYIIVSNSTEKRLNIIKKIAHLKNEILIEKPLINNPDNYFKYKLNKKNIYLGLQFSYSTYFKYIKAQIKNEKIKGLKLNWFHSKNEKKKFNKNIHFVEDVYYHFFSIIRIFLKNKNLINNYSSIKKNKIASTYKQTKIVLNASKDKKQKKRVLIVTTNKSEFVIDFKDMNEILIKKNKKFNKKIVKNIKNIPIQINNFLHNKNKIKENSLKNLNYLFDDLIKIKKFL